MEGAPGDLQIELNIFYCKHMERARFEPLVGTEFA